MRDPVEQVLDVYCDFAITQPVNYKEGDFQFAFFKVGASKEMAELMRFFSVAYKQIVVHRLYSGGNLNEEIERFCSQNEEIFEACYQDSRSDLPKRIMNRCLRLIRSARK